MMYICKNKLGEQVGVVYSKREADEIVRRANAELVRIEGTAEYARRAAKSKKKEAQELTGCIIGLVLSLILFILCAISVFG